MARRALIVLRPITLLLIVSAPCAAQAVTGRVLVEGAGRPALGAWVLLVDSTGEERIGALADSLGRFAVRAPVAGRFRVRAQLIGHETAESGPHELLPGRAIEVLLALREHALPLDPITVEAERRCEARPEAGAAAAIWDEAKKVLTAVQWTGRQALVTYRLRHFERTIGLDGRVRTANEQTSVRLADQPFTTPPASELAAKGYVQDEAGVSLFYAPDAAVLLSDAFAATHCFRALQGRGERAALVGLAFEPRGRDLPDVQGALWIDASTRALRSLEFQYTGIDYGPRTRELGGQLAFARLPSGAWIIESWLIRGPALAPRRASAAGRAAAPVLAGFKEAGGEVTEIIGGAGAAVRAARPVRRVGRGSREGGRSPLRGGRTAERCVRRAGAAEHRRGARARSLPHARDRSHAPHCSRSDR